MKLELKMSMKILAMIKQCLTLVIIQSTKSKYYDNSNKLVVDKMKDGVAIETAGVAIEEFVRLKLKRYLHLVNDNSEHKKAKGVNTNVVETISHDEY